MSVIPHQEMGGGVLIREFLAWWPCRLETSAARPLVRHPSKLRV